MSLLRRNRGAFGELVEGDEVADQIFELIALVGFYHTVSFFANGLRLQLEPYGTPFPE